MTKPELGVKRDCPNCGARFYDLNKEPAHCPKCDHDFVPEALLKPRRQRVEEVGEEAAAKPAAETSLEVAEKERKAAESKRKPALDEDEAAPGEEDEEDLPEIEDIDIDIDDEDDDSLLEDDDEDDDMSSIVSNKEEDD